jgi:tol-pal system protein YbgF
MLRPLLSLLAACVLFSGCARQLTRMETKLDSVAAEQGAQGRGRAELLAEIALLRAELDAQQGSSRERWAAMNARLDAVEQMGSRLNASWEEQQSLLRELRSALQLVERSAPNNSAGAGADSTARTLPDPSGSAGLEVFDAAMADFTRGNYTLARQGFQEVIDRFAGSDLALQSDYWVAETYYNQESYGEAYRRFDGVMAKSKSGDTARKSMLKMGYCLLELHDSTRARTILQRLIKEHPSSEEALIAESRLASLDSSP